MDKVVISVTSDGLTVDSRPGDIFPFIDAKLGLFVHAMYGDIPAGTALHLRPANARQKARASYSPRLTRFLGADRFIVGGIDHRVARGTPLDEPTAQDTDIDGYLCAADFDELLTMIGRRSGLAVHRPSPGEPTRCLLIPNPFESLPSKFLRSLRRLGARSSLAIDVGKDSISVIDPNTNAVITRALVAQVVATPATYMYYRKDGLTTPLLVVGVPGFQPLTITCLGGRFSWRGNVSPEKAPAYTVSGADWLTLVEEFGLAPQLEDATRQS